MDVQHVLQHLRVAFQPIVDFNTGEIFGHEALIRGAAGSAWELPSTLFPLMVGAGAEYLLEESCRRLAATQGANTLPDNQTLFMNLNTRCAPFTFPTPARYRATPQRLAIEISEQHPLLDNDALLTAIRQWRDSGHLIVLDDYGTGYAAANTVLALQPDIVKLDISLIHEIDQDERRQSLVASIRDYTHDLGIRLVAEGIETRAECEVLCQMGVDYGQGFWLSRPDVELPQQLRNRPPIHVTAKPKPASQPSTAELLRFYAEAIHHTEVPTYLVDRRRKILAWNEAAVRAVGHADHRMVNYPCFVGPLQHQDAAGRALCVGVCPLVQSMVSKNVVGSSDITLMTADGNRIRATTVVLPLWDPVQQRVVGAVEQFWPHPEPRGSIPPANLPLPRL